MTTIDEASKQLDAALQRLEGNLETIFERSGDPNVVRKEISQLAQDRARLAEELNASLEREKKMSVLTDEASSALGAAIAEVKAALERQGES